MKKAISLALQPTSVRTWQNVYWSIAALLPVLILIHGSDAAGKYSKADVVRNCIHALGVDDPADAVLVGDSDNDAIGAHEIGLGFVGVTYGFGFFFQRRCTCL